MVDGRNDCLDAVDLYMTSSWLCADIADDDVLGQQAQGE